MNNVYKFYPEYEDEFITPVDTSETSLLFSTALSIQNPLPCGKVLQVKLQGRRGFSQNSFYWLHPQCLVCDLVAYNKLNDLLSGCGFWSELMLDGEALYLFSVTKEINVLNEDDSDFVELNGFKLDIKRYSFKYFNESENPIFLITNMKGHYPLMSGYLVNKIKEFEISGLKFKLL